MNTLDLLYALDVNAFLLILIFLHPLRYWKVDAKTECLEIFDSNFTVQAVQLVNRKRQFSLKKTTSVSNSL